MRYGIMLQIVGIITLILVGSGALFAWLQRRPTPAPTEGRVNSLLELSDIHLYDNLKSI